MNNTLHCISNSEKISHFLLDPLITRSAGMAEVITDSSLSITDA